MAADPDVVPMLVSDIGPVEDGRFRWTGQNPEVKLELPATERLDFLKLKLKLRARFWVAGNALEDVGPIGIIYRVNGTVLDRASYATEGEHVFEKAVPASWLHTGENRVRMELDKIYPYNGAKLGVALAELGFAD